MDISPFIHQLVTINDYNIMLLYTFILTNHLTTMTKLRITAYSNLDSDAFANVLFKKLYGD